MLCATSREIFEECRADLGLCSGDGGPRRGERKRIASRTARGATNSEKVLSRGGGVYREAAMTFRPRAGGGRAAVEHARDYYNGILRIPRAGPTVPHSVGPRAPIQGTSTVCGL